MATRMVIPIPQPETQQDLAFEFIDRPDGLVEFRAESTEAHIVAFREVNSGIDVHYWSQGAIVASLTKKHGEKSAAIDDMAEAVELSANYLRKMARTYRTFQFVPRDTSLSFSHHRAACRHARPEEALAVAKAQGMSKNQLEDWVSEQAYRRATVAIRKAKRAVKNAERETWREHLMHMDQVIAEDFIKNSPNQEFARRVCAEWRVEIADELKQLEISEHRELIISAIDERGAENVKAIKKATGISTQEVGWIVARLVAENLYEWVDKFSLGRGSAEQILHRVGDADGTSFSLPNSGHDYAH